MFFTAILKNKPRYILHEAAMPAPTKQYSLPFTVQSENRKEPFSIDAEAAAIYSLAELERKSGGIIKQNEEKLAYITKIGYPLWLFPRDETTYVFDGLNKSSYNWQYFEAAQTKFLSEDFEASFKFRETYMAFLLDYQNRLAQALTRKELACNGLIANTDFLKELDTYRKETQTQENSSVALVSPALDEAKANFVVNQIETLQAQFKEQTEKLKQLSLLIIKTTSHYTTALQFESDAVKDEAQAKIKAQEELINPKIVSLKKEYNTKIDNLEKSIENEKIPLEKQKAKIGKNIEALEDKSGQYRKHVRIQANKGNSYSEESWKKKLKSAQKELSELEEQKKSTEKQLKRLVEVKIKETIRLKEELEAKVKLESQPIVDLEASRDVKMQVFRQEIDKLEKQTKPVLEELNRLVKQRENITSKTEPLGVKVDPKTKTTTLLYVPFYVACYQGVSSKRYFTVSPSLAGSLGFSAKLKSALGRAKIKDLLVPRFKAVSGLADKIRLSLDSDSGFEAEIEELSQKNSILKNSAGHLDVKKGLASLRDEGWLSAAEYQSFSEKI